ncbi:protein spaetzle 3 [Phlebotomus papatasi]|uniref:protein spaetzle 3 n=1 Tax=Phlebotomus papatasi TaxID=29031 RepID=UPI00248440D2|nr:protein spaetzle 3 [Phlebotomus papatasi]
MALANFSLPFGAVNQPWVGNLNPLQPPPQHISAVNNLLYGPAGHQENDVPIPDNEAEQEAFFKNSPYAPPRNSQYRQRNNYLPPPPSPQPPVGQNAYSTPTHTPRNYQPSSRTYGEGLYSMPSSPSTSSNTQFFNNANPQNNYNNGQPYSAPPTQPPSGARNVPQQTQKTHQQPSGGYPQRPPGYTKVNAGTGSRTQVHAVLDYDEEESDDFYSDHDESSPDSRRKPQQVPGGKMPTVTPIQGPIFIKNGSVPVVPLFSYPTVNNGSLVQIPILWTALSVALGIDIRGEIIRGIPCIKRNYQLFCPSAGNTYPSERIETFIDENKALMRRMYGDFQMSSEYGPPLQRLRKKKRSADSESGIDEDDWEWGEMPGVPDMIGPPGSGPDPIRDAGPSGDSYFTKWRSKRQSQRQGNANVGGNRSTVNAGNQRITNPGPTNANDSSGRLDVCESKVEIVAPYWASNSAGKIRAIVNTQHFEQAIHQEVCTKPQTTRCGGDCGCEQKYKWHRLLAYDPDNDCKGIFMDWFLFPSCCVCRCNP